MIVEAAKESDFLTLDDAIFTVETFSQVGGTQIKGSLRFRDIADYIPEQIRAISLSGLINQFNKRTPSLWYAREIQGEIKGISVEVEEEVTIRIESVVFGICSVSYAKYGSMGHPAFLPADTKLYK